MKLFYSGCKSRKSGRYVKRGRCKSFRRVKLRKLFRKGHQLCFFKC